MFLSYFGGIQVGIWKNQDFATTVFFWDVGSQSCCLLKVASFWSLQNTQRNTKSRRTPLLTHKRYFFSQSKPTSSFHIISKEIFLLLGFFEISPAPCFPADLFFSEAKCLRQIVHHDGNLDLCLRVRLPVMGPLEMPSFSQGPVAKP